MFATIRSYRVASVDELSELVREEFVPVVETIPGLVAYYELDTGAGTASSITVCRHARGVDPARSTLVGTNPAHGTLATTLGAELTLV